MARDAPLPATPARRRLLHGAAWATPLLAVATAAPAIAASEPGPAPNSSADYYWASAANGSYLTLAPAASELQFQVSAQISYRADPWADPPEGATLQVVVELSQPARLETSGAGWEVSPAVGGTASSFVFSARPAGFGGALTGSFRGTAAGDLLVTGTMSVIDPGNASWAQEQASDAGRLTA